MRALNGWACLLKNHKREKANNVLSRFFRDLEFPFKALMISLYLKLISLHANFYGYLSLSI